MYVPMLHMFLIRLLLAVFLKVSKGAKIRNLYNQVPHLTQDTNFKLFLKNKNNVKINCVMLRTHDLKLHFAE